MRTVQNTKTEGVSQSPQFRSSYCILLAGAMMFGIWFLSKPTHQLAVYEKPKTSEEKVEASAGLAKWSPAVITGGLIKGGVGGDSVNKLQQRFVAYKGLGEKVLKTEEESRKYLDLISDPELIEASTTILLRPDLTRKVSQVQSERLERVDFLIKSLHSPENPSLNFTLEAVEKVILEAKVDPSWPETLKRAWVGDRVELFMALKHRFPERAQQLRSRAAGDASSARILAYADSFYNHQKADGVRQ
jgi:hypothetical protein